ncbi:MAG TPA: hypothetical protein VME46_12825, partial [Acidimicrobiales bacterium]|nr:hypothetical protein [Acidimicrobiales bacterium]
VETTPLSYQSGSPPVAITGTLTVSDADDSTIASATVAITSGFASGKETLSFINQNGITGSYNASTGVLSLSGDATVADYQAALRSVEFSSTSGAGTRTISFTVTDSLGATSNTATRTIDIVAAATPDSLIVDQFRLGGPGGPGDSYADLYNASGSPLDVDGWSLGYDLAGGTLATAPLPDDTIPAGGSLLMAGPEYSLSSVASPDGTFGSGQTLDLSGGFEVLGPGSTTVDSVGFTGSGLSEGTALTVPANTSTQYAFVRNRSTGVPADTGNNAADFISVSVGGPSALAGSTLGAPAPSDLASPTPTGYAATSSLLNPSVAQTASPNRVIVSSPPTLEVRRTITNQGTTTLTNLELRIVAITTEGSPGGSAQLLAENSPSTTVTVDSHSVTVEGLTLAAPSLAGAGGLDATLSVPLQGGELAPGQSVSVQLYFAVPVGGSYSFTYQILANQI